jgi:DNA-binding GntR family transcriptional regulator
MSDREDAVYQGVVDLVFHGDHAPGARLVEENLAAKLGVSRAPVRETLAKLVGQGVLVRGRKGEGVRVRGYSPEDVRQLYEYREVLEGVAARAAAQLATSTDITRMEVICREAEKELEHCDEKRWCDLDIHFHAALAEASHNKRIIPQLKLLLSECRYIFFNFVFQCTVHKMKPDQAIANLESVRQDHEALLDLVKSRDADGAERKARDDMRKSAERIVRLMITGDLEASRGGRSSDAKRETSSTEAST